MDDAANQEKKSGKTDSGRKILIGSQRDAADPSLRSGKKRLGMIELSPKRVNQAVRLPVRDAAPPVTADNREGSVASDLPPLPSESQPPTATSEAATATRETPQPAPAPPETIREEPSRSDLLAAASGAQPIPAIESPSPPLDTSYASLAIDDELEAAIEGIEMDSLIGEAPARGELELDARIKGVVTRVHNDNVFFSLKSHFEGVASRRQFKSPPVEGAMLEVVVTGFREDEGLYDVTIPGAAVSVADWSDLNEGAVVEARISGSNTGGLECIVHNIRGFIPASQIAIGHVDHFGDFVNQKFQCVVTEVNPRRKRLVLSRRAVLEREAEEKKQELLASLKVGQTLEGVVTRLMDFGAFVDIGGAEGLVHVSKLSWERVDHPREVLEPGQKIQVKVEKLSPGSGKIGLSLRDTGENPWTRIEEKFPVGSVVDGTVTRLAQFGAFVRLESGIEGLIHISELAHHRVIAVKNVVSAGDAVNVKVLSIDPSAQKIGLSLKATQSRPETPDTRRDDEAAEPIRELAVKRRDEPLKGGRGRNSGGEQFGLNW